ncbi:EAL domain-containing protein [Methylobacillus arboreus]|uniref:bifunctional diguanylate cyclase/phosphodiesterase n=1 Tax=Methylobacillus arboreus TaxID=755170 RepID=UPI001E2B280F|nr:bifunctional diguanylate cyclase/phosphodiesterase [Methylobacillus arboreus]MCB5190952.1 EAL domain-containing protein [Methylobacillus arboreus]
MSSANISGQGLNDTMQLDILSFAINRIQEAIFICDAEARICLVNLAGCEQLGYSEAELLQMSANEILSGLDVVNWQAYWQTLQQQQAITRETQLRTKAGAIVPVEIRANYFLEAGKQAYCVLVARNITSRLNMLEKLREQELQYRQVVMNSPDIFIRYDHDCRRIFLSDGYESVFGIPVEKAFGRRPTEIWGTPAMQPEQYEARLREVMTSGVAQEIELDWMDGNQYVCQFLHAVPERNVKGKITGVLIIARDISHIRRVERELRKREQYQSALIENFPFVVWIKDLNSKLLAANSAYARFAKVASQAELEGKTDFDLFPYAHAKAYVDGDKRVLESGLPFSSIEPFEALDGGRGWMEAYKSPMVLDGKLVGTVGFFRDITAIKQNEEKLIQRERELQSLIDNTPDTIIRYDLNARRLYINTPRLKRVGIAADKLIGSTPTEYPGGDAYVKYEEKIKGVIKSATPDFLELHGKGEDDSTWFIHVRIVPEFGDNGAVVGVLAVERDITELMEYRERIHYLAYYDALTGLPNRTLFADRVNQVLADASWHEQRFGLMMLDLDRFKEVNDSLGHQAGDDLLVAVAQRLNASVRSYDTIARLSGDEFAILLPDLRNPDDLATIARKINDEIAKPFQIQNKELFISTSIGIAIYPNDGDDRATLFKSADVAMYHAKSYGRNNYQFYSQELGSKASEYIMLGASIRQALKNSEFELCYQPQIDLMSGRIVGAEALLRWRNPQLGVVMPDRFIKVAEESGLIVEIGEWVLREACNAVVCLNHDRSPELSLSMAVNLSSRQFLYNDLLTSVKEILAETGCKPEWLKLEITESLLLEDSQEIITTLSMFKEMGITISIDDFCTGYSAMSYLGQFPISQVKIDRSFVRDIAAKQDKLELITAIIRIAHALRLELVAEGVESKQQANLLKIQGCTIAQGYFFGKPMRLRHLKLIIADGEDLMQ